MADFFKETLINRNDEGSYLYELTTVLLSFYIVSVNRARCAGAPGNL